MASWWQFASPYTGLNYLFAIWKLGPTLNHLQQEQRGESAFRVTEDQVFIVNFDGPSDHSVEEAEGWRPELHDIGFASHGMTTRELQAKP
jgi:hypothetical protein